MHSLGAAILAFQCVVFPSLAFQQHAPSQRTDGRALPSALRSTIDKPGDVITNPITGSETNVKFPTARGTTTDARKFITYGTPSGDGGDESPLLALRLNHILFASEELAKQTLDKLTKAEWNFESMAGAVSNCAETRDEGGSVGWINLAEDFDLDDEPSEEESRNPNEHLELILPRSARKEILETPTKPGDILMVQSRRGVHLVQVRRRAKPRSINCSEA